MLKFSITRYSSTYGKIIRKEVTWSGAENFKSNAKVFSSSLNCFLVTNEVLILLLFLCFKSEKQHYPEYIINIDKYQWAENTLKKCIQICKFRDLELSS